MLGHSSENNYLLTVAWTISPGHLIALGRHLGDINGVTGQHATLGFGAPSCLWTHMAPGDLHTLAIRQARQVTAGGLLDIHFFSLLILRIPPGTYAPRQWLILATPSDFNTAKETHNTHIC